VPKKPKITNSKGFEKIILDDVAITIEKGKLFDFVEAKTGKSIIVRITTVCFMKKH
jgi:ABC-type transporter Mla maintaining outer membrane lipid asymmetry ATPase subunit MlaF